MGADSHSFALDFTRPPAMRELRKLCEERFQRPLPRLRVFSEQGVEYEENDLRYLAHEERFYVSDGADFDPLSCLGEYQIGEKLGEGGFGAVYKAVHREKGETVAIKLVSGKSTSSSFIGILFKEVQLLKGLSHRSIIKIHNCFTLKDMRIIIVMEYMAGGELRQVIRDRKLSEDEARQAFASMIAAISYCHDNNLIHKDLKPENILLERQNDITSLKIADFGISGLLTDEPSDANFGTLRYMPPQVLARKEKGNHPSTDIWALGLILFLMVFQRYPFQRQSIRAMVSAIVGCDYTFTSAEKKQSSPELQDLIRRILVPERKDRITMRDLQAHPWMEQRKMELELPPPAPGSAKKAESSLVQSWRGTNRKVHERLSSIPSKALVPRESKHVKSVTKNKKP